MNEIAQIITSIATLVAALSALIVGLRNSRKITEVHASTNGKMEELVSEVRKSSFAAGEKEQKDNPK